MILHAFAAEIHKNSVAHGWWDEEMSLYQAIALIHSEWSEALEEARAGRPMLWYECCNLALANNGLCKGCKMHKEDEPCAWRNKKPEGIAVELIDGVIRILDLLGEFGADYMDADSGQSATMESLWEKAAVLENIPEDIPTLIAFLHKFTAEAVPDNGEGFADSALLAAMSLALTWIHERGLDPLALMLEKHAYNQERPYRHGKKF